MRPNEVESRSHSWIEPRALMVATALVAGCGLALQVTLTRVFSHMIWHHFTYLVIGVALLGSGAAGTFLSVRGWAFVCAALLYGIALWSARALWQSRPISMAAAPVVRAPVLESAGD